MASIWTDIIEWLSDTAITPGRLNDYIGEDAGVGGNLQWLKDAVSGLGLVNPGGRLTLESGVAISITDQLAKTTVLYTPYLTDIVSLYDTVGGAWELFTFTEQSIAVPATTNTPFDVFIYDNAGTPTLEVLSWTNDTTRATALATQDGRLIKSGDASRVYLGTGRTTGVSGECEDSTTRRLLWNYYNRLERYLTCGDPTNNWTYTILVYRPSNGNTTLGVGRVDLVIGVAECLIDAVAKSFTAHNIGGIGQIASGVGLDSTTVNSAQQFGGAIISQTFMGIEALYKGTPAAGYHYLQHLEISPAVGITTWYGDNGTPGETKNGLSAVLEM